MNIITERRNEKFSSNLKVIRDELILIRKNVKEGCNPEMRAYLHFIYAIIVVALKDSFIYRRPSKCDKESMELRDDAMDWLQTSEDFDLSWSILTRQFGTGIKSEDIRQRMTDAWRCSCMFTGGKKNAAHARRAIPRHLVAASEHRIW